MLKHVIIITTLFISTLVNAQGNIRAHYSELHQTVEVAAEININNSPFQKVGVSGVSNGAVDMKYIHLFMLKPNFFITTKVGIYTQHGIPEGLSPIVGQAAGLHALSYGRAGFAYVPHQQVTLFADHLESYKLTENDMIEQRLSRAGITIKPINNLEVIYRYSRFDFYNISDVAPALGNLRRHEYYLSYKFDNGLKPFFIVKDVDGVDLDFNIGLQYDY